MQVGFFLFCALFVGLGFTAWFSTSATITNSIPAVVTALLGLVTNPVPAGNASPAPAPADANPGPAGNASPGPAGSWAQVPWRTLIVAGGLSTAVCALAMIITDHKAAQGAFEVAAGGLFGLLIDTSQLSAFQPALTVVAKVLGVGGNAPK
jgi:hypothetical protein